MYVDELGKAVTKVGKLLKDAGVRAAVDRFRTSKGDERATAAVKLAEAGGVLVEKMSFMNESEKLVVQSLSLQSLATPEYWVELTSPNADTKAQQAEVVRLASRVVFATNHLPAMVGMLHATNQHSTSIPESTSGQKHGAPACKVGPGESALSIRLTDAGERASDPDRIARAIDGIDMLYSACASIIRKPTVELRLDDLSAKLNNDRDFRFVGELESINAVFAVIDTIPAALADIDPERDIDLDSVVRSLPIFQDLRKLGSLGTFSNKDLNDISETMHQGAMLTLESGVILNIEDARTGATDRRAGSPEQSSRYGNDEPPTLVSRAKPNVSAAEHDEDYQQYLREREALKRSNEEPVLEGVTSNTGESDAGNDGKSKDNRKAAIDQLLKSLGRSKNG